jgi:hypothetical protein
MALAVALRIDEWLVENGQGRLRFPTLVVDGPSETNATEYVIAYIQPGDGSNPIRQAMTAAMIAHALERYGLTITASDCIVPTFQRGL